MLHEISVNLLRNITCHIARRNLFKHCPTAKKNARKKICVTVLGATSYMGQILTLMLKQCPLIGEVRMYCPNKLQCGLALELAHIDTNANVKAYFGSHLLIESLVGADVIAVCSNLPHTPICEPTYLESVGYYIKNYATFAAEVNPDAIFCIGCPPIDSLVPLVSEEYKRAGAYDHRKIIGIPMVACCRANTIIASNLKLNPCLVRIPILGGVSSDTIVPVISQTRPAVEIPPALIDAFYKKIIESEDDMLEEKCREQTGGCDILYAFGTSRFITSLARGIIGRKEIYECAYVRQVGEIAKFLPYMSCLARLTKDGITDTYIPNLNEYEAVLLEKVAVKLKKSINLGQSFITGDIPKIKRMPFKGSSICQPPNLDCYVLQANLSSIDGNGKKSKEKSKGENVKEKAKPVKIRPEDLQARKQTKKMDKNTNVTTIKHCE